MTCVGQQSPGVESSASGPAARTRCCPPRAVRASCCPSGRGRDVRRDGLLRTAAALGNGPRSRRVRDPGNPGRGLRGVPNLEFNVLLKVSVRLRNRNKHILAVHLYWAAECGGHRLLGHVKASQGWNVRRGSVPSRRPWHSCCSNLVKAQHATNQYSTKAVKGRLPKRSA
jgi:hypothetical protein